MAWASRSGRAFTSISSPRAFAVCDRCGFWYNHVALRWQYDYAGPSLVNLRLLVCARCEDRPQEQLRAIVIPPDPVPIANPRPENPAVSSPNYRVTSGQDTVDPVTGLTTSGAVQRATQTPGGLRVTQQTGEPPFGLNTLPGTDPNAPGGEDPGLPYGNDTVPSTGPL